MVKMKNDFAQGFVNEFIKTIHKMGYSIPSNVLKMDYYTMKQIVAKYVKIAKSQNNHYNVNIGMQFLSQY